MFARAYLSGFLEPVINHARHSPWYYVWYETASFCAWFPLNERRRQSRCTNDKLYMYSDDMLREEIDHTAMLRWRRPQDNGWSMFSAPGVTRALCQNTNGRQTQHICSATFWIMLYFGFVCASVAHVFVYTQLTCVCLTILWNIMNSQRTQTFHRPVEVRCSYPWLHCGWLRILICTSRYSPAHTCTNRKRSISL